MAEDVLPYSDISNTNKISKDVFFFSAPLDVTKQAAQAGDSTAQLALGYWLMKGRQHTEAVNWFEKAAHSGSVDAQFLLEVSTIYRRSQKTDLSDVWGEIRQSINRAALGNVPFAQFALGEAVPVGDFGFKKDENLGEYWRSRAASNGLCLAVASSAMKDATDICYPAQLSALNWYLKLADKGEVLSKYNAAITLIKMAVHSSGEEQKKQISQASNLLESCKTMGLRRSAEDVLDFLNMLYFLDGPPWSPIIVWNQKKKPHNIEMLGRIASAFDPDKKYTDLLFAADACPSKSVGELVGQLVLPIQLFVKDRNKNTAIQWYKIAAENGDLPSATSLGTCFEKGKGVQIDKSEAKKWYLIAAKGGNAFAQWLLGGLLADDFQDSIEAYKWLNISIATDQKEGSNREPFALDDLNKLEKRMTREQVLEAQRRSTAFLEGKPEASEGESAPRQGTALECKASGTGFFITTDGYIITASHVVHDVARVEIKTKAGKVKAKIIRTDPANDIAILKAEGRFVAIPLENSKTVKLGDVVTTIGFPNPELQGFSPKLTRGEIGSLFGLQDDPRHFQISAPIQPGNSGGPLLNASGNAIGTLVARLSDKVTYKVTGMLPQNVNYALKSSYVLAMIEAMPDISEKLPKPRNGVHTTDEIVKDTESAIIMILVY